jgi:hypothetical protein
MMDAMSSSLAGLLVDVIMVEWRSSICAMLLVGFK